MASKTKPKSKKTVNNGPALWKQDGMCVVQGELRPGPGRPSRHERLFQYVAEKLPFDSLSKVEKALSDGDDIEGVYIAHDSMGVARYGGRGQIFTRLAQHKRKYRRELQYFSFYVINAKGHEREIETVVLRAAGPQMTLNRRKVARGTEPGDVRDYEPGTGFFEQQKVRGRKKKRKRGKRAALRKGSGKRHVKWTAAA